MQASAGPPSALERDLTDDLFSLLRRLLLDPEADHLRVIEEHDLTLSQVRALLLLACADPEALPGGRIAERLGLSPAAISRALDGLVHQGFVERMEAAQDRRVRLVAIAPAGRRIAEELTALRRAQIKRFIAGLDAEQRARLGDALGALGLNGERG